MSALDVVEVRRAALSGVTERRRFEVRAQGEGDSGVFRGLASATGVEYRIHDYLGAYREVVRAGAFRATLAESPIVVLNINHAGLPLASTRATPPTLRLWEDDEGLQVEARLLSGFDEPDRIAAGIARGDVSEMSFAFRTVSDVWDGDLRTLQTVSLHRGDVSIVTYGANAHTWTGMRRGGDSGGSAEPVRAEALSDEAAMALASESARFAAALAGHGTGGADPDDGRDEAARIAASIADAQRRIPVLAPG